MVAYAQPESKLLLRSGTTFLIEGGKDSTGRYVWFFIRVDSAKIRAFTKAHQTGGISLKQYGEILASGFGNSPPLAVIKRMKKFYGYKGEDA